MPTVRRTRKIAERRSIILERQLAGEHCCGEDTQEIYGVEGSAAARAIGRGFTACGARDSRQAIETTEA